MLGLHVGATCFFVHSFVFQWRLVGAPVRQEIRLKGRQKYIANKETEKGVVNYTNLGWPLAWAREATCAFAV